MVPETDQIYESTGTSMVWRQRIDGMVQKQSRDWYMVQSYMV